jgi:hypothetical protein
MNETYSCLSGAGFKLSKNTFMAVYKKFDRDGQQSKFLFNSIELSVDEFIELSIFLGSVRNIFNNMDKNK